MMKKLFFFLFVCLSINSFPQDNRFIIGSIHNIDSKILGEARQVFVSVPLSYTTGRGNYPVLYLLDGGTHFQYTSGIMNYLAAGGYIPEMIVVAIPNTNRNRDFTPTAVPETQGTGGADKFISFMEEELFPLINKEYRTTQYKILFGHSLTAMFSIYTMLSRPGMFNAYIAASPYVMYDNNYIVRKAPELLREKYEPLQYLYITIGNEPDYFNPLGELTDLLKSKAPSGLKFDYIKMPDDDHGTIPVKAINNGISALFADWALPADFPQTGTVSSLKTHFENLSNKMGIPVTAPEARVNLSGYQVMQAGRVDEALRLFEYNIELYPNSANVYDSYGEGLEAANKFDLAEKNYAKAVELGTQNNDPNLEIFKQHLEAVRKKI
jgi:predicted alpha/beta superfamily hydrolase